MLLAATTRSMLLVYVGVLGFFVLWAMAGVFTRDINNEWYAVLLDPFGVRAFGRMTRYLTAAESNASLPPLSGFLLANRLLWLGITVVLFAATVILFKPQRTGTGKRLFGKPKAETVAPAVTAPLHLPRSVPTFTAATAWRQWWQILRLLQHQHLALSRRQHLRRQPTQLHLHPSIPKRKSTLRWLRWIPKLLR